MPYSLLVIANKTCPCPELRAEIGRRAREHDGGQVLIVAPALNSRLAHYVSDTDRAVAAARARLDLAVAFLAEEGVTARGEVGDAEPLVALEDALVEFAADEVIVTTHPLGESHWLERGLVDRARERVSVPVTHVQTPYGVQDPV